jgi:hypothetical protein
MSGGRLKTTPASRNPKPFWFVRARAASHQGWVADWLWVVRAQLSVSRVKDTEDTADTALRIPLNALDAIVSQ